MFYPIDGFSGILIVLFIIFYWRYETKSAQSLSNAKKQFLAKPEVQAYIKDGYEIVKITDKGNGIYNFELSKKSSDS